MLSQVQPIRVALVQDDPQVRGGLQLKVLDQAEIGRTAELGPGFGILWGYDPNLGWMQGYLKGYCSVVVEADGRVLPPVEEPPGDPAPPTNDNFRLALALRAKAATSLRLKFALGRASRP